MSKQASAQLAKAGSLFAPVKGLSLQRKCDCGNHTIAGGECDTCSKDYESSLRRSAINRESANAPQQTVLSIINDVLRWPGQPLDATTRAFMEPRFAQDFSHVRVHTDSRAAESARAVNALAYTIGRDLVFAAGEYRPQALQGRRLLAHELAHVVQQRNTTHNPGLMHRLRVSDVDDPAEREADAMAERSLATGMPTLSHSQVNSSRFNPVTPIIQRRVGSPTTTTSTACSPDQKLEILDAAKGAVRGLDKVVGRLDAFLTSPTDARNKPVSDALSTYFKSKATNIATYVRGQLNRFRSDLSALSTFKVECHGIEDATCKHSQAYVPRNNREMIVLCSSFFGGQARATANQISALVHEITHAQVGRTHITDRAYSSDRLFRHLTTEEALTNADSYEDFFEALETGVTPKVSIPADTFEDCPVAWRNALGKALATAQRWNREAQVSVGKLTPELARSSYSAADINLIEGNTQRGIDSYRKAVNKVAKALESKISFECEPEGGGRCDNKTVAYWYAIGDLHICPTLIKEPPANQAADLLGALYGDEADVSGEPRLSNYARFAQRQAKEAAPSMQQILGSPAWSADSLRIQFDALEPSTPKHQYNESGTDHERLSNDLPTYSPPTCGPATLPFRCRVWFFVDGLQPRPSPFAPPRVSVDFQFPGPRGRDRKSFSDLRAHSSRTAGFNLETKLPNKFEFKFTNNGPFEMRFELQDPDTRINRVYQDTIQIEANRPCTARQQDPKSSPHGLIPP